MERIMKAIWWILTGLFAITAIITIFGIVYMWFINPDTELPYMNILFTKLILEGIALILLLARQSIHYLPKVKVYKNSEEVNKFLKEFALRGSSVEFVSNRATWLTSDRSLQEALVQKAEAGYSVSVLTAKEPGCISTIGNSKINFINGIPEEYIPNARFTLINSSRQGAEELAIAVGSFPGHEVYIFNNRTSPHIIGLAKDIVKLMHLCKGTRENE